MSHAAYKRTSGYRNWVNRRCYLPRIEGVLARLATGRMYRIMENGEWRRV